MRLLLATLLLQMLPPLAIVAVLAVALSGCTVTTADVPTDRGPAHLSSYRLFSSTAITVNADGSVSYSSDPQAQQASDLFKQGLELGAKLGTAAAAGGISYGPMLEAREPPFLQTAAGRP